MSGPRADESPKTSALIITKADGKIKATTKSSAIRPAVFVSKELNTAKATACAVANTSARIYGAALT